MSEQGEHTRYNQQEALTMAITKKQDANTVQVANDALEVLKNMMMILTMLLDLIQQKELKSQLKR